MKHWKQSIDNFSIDGNVFGVKTSCLHTLRLRFKLSLESRFCYESPCLRYNNATLVCCSDEKKSIIVGDAEFLFNHASKKYQFGFSILIQEWRMVLLCICEQLFNNIGLLSEELNSLKKNYTCLEFWVPLAIDLLVKYPALLPVIMYSKRCDDTKGSQRFVRFVLEKRKTSRLSIKAPRSNETTRVLNFSIKYPNVYNEAVQIFLYWTRTKTLKKKNISKT